MNRGRIPRKIAPPASSHPTPLRRISQKDGTPNPTTRSHRSHRQARVLPGIQCLFLILLLKSPDGFRCSSVFVVSGFYYSTTTSRPSPISTSTISDGVVLPVGAPSSPLPKSHWICETYPSPKRRRHRPWHLSSVGNYNYQNDEDRVPIPRNNYTNSSQETKPRNDAESSSLIRDAKRRNTKITTLGNTRNGGDGSDWAVALSDLYWKERDDFNVINMATMLHQISNHNWMVDNQQQQRQVVETLVLDSLQWIQECGLETIDSEHQTNLRRSYRRLQDLSPTIREQVQCVFPSTPTKQAVSSTATMTINSVTNKYQQQREINDRLVALGRSKDWTGILEIYQQEREHFSFVNFATCMSQLGRILSSSQQPPRESNAAVGDIRLEGHINDIADQLIVPKQALKVWKAREISNVLHALCKLPNAKGAAATERLIQSVLQDEIMEAIIQTDNVQNIANTVYACAMLNAPCPALFLAIDNQAVALVKNGKVQEISSIAYACAVSETRCPAFFQAINENAVELVGEKATTQTIANIAWSCAVLDVSDCPLLFDAIESQAEYFVKHAKAQEISNTAWACSVLEIPCPCLFRAIDENAASRVVDTGSPQAISNTALAAAKLNHECPRLFACIEKRLYWVFEHGTAQAISNTIWAFGRKSLYSPALIDALEKYGVEACLPRVGRSDGIVYQLEARSIAFALSQFGVTSRVFFDELRVQIAATVHQNSASNQFTTNLCYSFAVLDLALEYETEFRLLWNRAIQINDNELETVERIQLLQTFIMVSRVMKIPPPNELLKSPASLTVELTDSRSQQEMSHLLQQLGVKHEVEASPFPTHVVDLGLLSIDAACRERMIAIEFDGPSHFLRDACTSKVLEGMENGPTKAKRGLLERLGWKVVNISYLDWVRAATIEGKKQLLTQKLRSAVHGTPQ